MNNVESIPFESIIRRRINTLNLKLLKTNLLTKKNLYDCIQNHMLITNKLRKPKKWFCKHRFIKTIICLIFFAFIGLFSVVLIDICMGIRCILPNNYLIWEATRPISDCKFCIDIHRPIILSNITKHEFMVRFILILIKNLIQFYYRFIN